MGFSGIGGQRFLGQDSRMETFETPPPARRPDPSARVAALVQMERDLMAGGDMREAVLLLLRDHIETLDLHDGY